MRSAAAQRHKINRAVNFSLANMGEPLSLDSLADAACLSRYHFTRVFQTHMNQTPFAFLARIRAERAARELVFYRDKSVTEIAFDSGFSCVQTFSRAFKNRFRMTPRDFRTNNLASIEAMPGTRVPPDVQNILASGEFEKNLEGVEVRIEKRPAYRVAYVRHVGAYFNADGGIGAAECILSDWARSRGLWHPGAAIIGLCPDNPSITPGDRCIYDVCLPVPQHVGEDDTVSIQIIPAGTFAVLKIQGTAGWTYSAWSWLIYRWARGSSTPCKASACYEYVPAANGQPGYAGTGIEICMRIAER